MSGCLSTLNQRNGGSFITIEVYEWLRRLEANEQVDEEKEDSFSRIWNNLVPRKIIVHAWRVLWERLLTKTKLQSRGVAIANNDINCILCEEKAETVRHIFFECQYSYQIWMECSKWMGIPMAFPSKPLSNLDGMFSNLLRGKLGIKVATGLWECIV